MSARMIRRVLLVLGAAIALLGTGSVNPAAADCGLGGSCSGVHTQAVNTGYFSLGGTSCGAYVSPSGFGGTCAAPGTYSGNFPTPPTWQEIIKMSPGRTFDPCRHQRIDKGFNKPEPPADPKKRAKGDEWLIRICMKNYDLGTTDGGDNLELVFDRVWAYYEGEPGWMDYLWGDVAGSQSTFPFPVIGYGPHAYPVVGTPTFFWATFNELNPDGSLNELTTDEVVPQYQVPLGRDTNKGLDVVLNARLVRFNVNTGEDEGSANCSDVNDWTRPFKTGQDTVEQFAKKTKCQWTYTHSSADQGFGTYTVTARARWQIGWSYVDANGQTTTQMKPLSSEGFSEVTTESRYNIPVGEVQVRGCVLQNQCTRPD